ncbi:MAG: hypothetical protein FWD71_11245 [Oscillospiraceae bacterium]|nr:hypothetical protein [Oscillospiraceae bacterium]
MKKIIIVLIIALYLLILLASCENNNLVYTGDNTDLSKSEDGFPDDTSFDYTANADADSNVSGTINNIIIDGKEYTLYLYDKYDPSDPCEKIKQPIFPGIVLTNSIVRSVSPMLVMEGDTFLGWKTVKINADYTCFVDGRMYPDYGVGVTVNFEGEVTVKAKIDYYKDDFSGEFLYITPDDEYQGLFPMLYNEGKEYTYRTGFCPYNFNEIVKILGYKYGEYECEMTVKDFQLVRVPLERFSAATIDDMSVLSVIEYYAADK